MKCRDFEQEIFLYRELAAIERSAVDDHIKRCDACRELLVRVQQTETFVSNAASSKPQPENFSKLTSNIMQAVGSQQKQSASWLNSLFVKYAMVAASLSLVFVFGVEQSASITVHKAIPRSATVPFNSVSLKKTFLDRKKNSATNKPSLYACVKSGDCNNTIIETFKKKSF
jgi:predicted anti-sigma-YlaC factor YlaD